MGPIFNDTGYIMCVAIPPKPEFGREPIDTIYIPSTASVIGIVRPICLSRFPFFFVLFIRSGNFILKNVDISPAPE